MTILQRAGLTLILIVIAAILIIGPEYMQALNWIQWILLSCIGLGSMLLVYEDD